MTEKILQENPGRFVLFPIKHHDIWKYYNQTPQENPELK